MVLEWAKAYLKVKEWPRFRVKVIIYKEHLLANKESIKGKVKDPFIKANLTKVCLNLKTKFTKKVSSKVKEYSKVFLWDKSKVKIFRPKFKLFGKAKGKAK